jgi:hypothetical protein
MARYIDADLFLEKMKKTNRYFDVKFDIEEMPTAEVVPKSEVDDLKRYIILNEDIAIKCKQENGEENEEYWKGKISAFRQIRAYIDAELKKKYTAQTAEKYFTPDEVRRMSQKEVRDNYQAIMDSMKKWK